MEFTVDSIIKKPFSGRNYIEKLEIHLQPRCYYSAVVVIYQSGGRYSYLPYAKV